MTPTFQLQRSGVILRDAARGVYAQMYYWGHDVRHPGGNLLVRYGMTRLAKTTVKGTSRYRLAWGEGLIELHGFCAGWYGEEGGVVFYRPRNAWLPWPHAQPPEPSSLESAVMSHPQTHPRELLAKTAALMAWIYEYETWAQQQWGVDARRSHYQAFLKLRPRRWWLPPEVSLQWLKQYAGHPVQVARPKTLLTSC